jgi:hypothetical protein
LNGFLRMRPVFFSIELTFDSSFFSSTFAGVGVGAGLAATFLTGAGTAAAAVGAVGLPCWGFGSSEAGGCDSGVGFTFTSAGTGFVVVLAALGAGGV